MTDFQSEVMSAELNPHSDYVFSLWQKNVLDVMTCKENVNTGNDTQAEDK